MSDAAKASGDLRLESLYVEIYAKFNDYQEAVTRLITKNETLTATFTALTASVVGLDTALKNLSRTAGFNPTQLGRTLRTALRGSMMTPAEAGAAASANTSSIKTAIVDPVVGIAPAINAAAPAVKTAVENVIKAAEAPMDKAARKAALMARLTGKARTATGAPSTLQARIEAERLDAAAALLERTGATSVAQAIDMATGASAGKAAALLPVVATVPPPAVLTPMGQGLKEYRLLQDLARQRGLSTGGSKADIQKRLSDYAAASVAQAQAAAGAASATKGFSNLQAQAARVLMESSARKAAEAAALAASRSPMAAARAAMAGTILPSPTGPVPMAGRSLLANSRLGRILALQAQQQVAQQAAQRANILSALYTPTPIPTRSLAQAIGSHVAFAGQSAASAAGRLAQGAGGLLAFVGKTAGTSTLAAAQSGLSRLGSFLFGAGNAATGAKAGIFNFNKGLHDLTLGAFSANGSLRFLRFSLLGIAGLSIAVFAQFDDAMTRTLARMGDYNQQNRAMFEEGVMAISSESIISAVELTRALGSLTASGMNAAMALRSLAIAENYAVASGEDMAQATNQLITIMTGLGLSSRNVQTDYANMTRVSDVLIRTHQLVNVTVHDLAASFSGRFMASLRDANVGLETGTAVLAAYAAAGIHGADAGNRASQLFDTLSQTAIGNAFRWRQLGLQVINTDGSMRGIADIVQMLEERLSGMSFQSRHAMLGILGFNHMTARSILPLIGMSHVIREMNGELDNAAGTTDRFSEMMRGSFMFQIMNLWNNIKNLFTQVGSIIAPVIANISDAFKGFAQWFTALNPAIKSLLTWMAIMVALAGPLMIIFNTLFGKIVSFGLALIPVFVQLAVFGSIIAGFIPVILGFLALFLGVLPLIIGLVARLAGWMTTVAEIGSDFFLFTWIAQIPLVKGLLDTIHAQVTGIGLAGAGAWQRMKESALIVFDWLRTALRNVAGFFYNFSENMESILDWLQEGENWQNLLIDAITLGITFTGNMLHNLAEIFYFISNVGFITWKAFFDIGVKAAQIGLPIIGELFVAMMEDISPVVNTMFQNIAHNLALAFQDAFDTIGRGFVSTVLGMSRVPGVATAFPGLAAAATALELLDAANRALNRRAPAYRNLFEGISGAPRAATEEESLALLMAVAGGGMAGAALHPQRRTTGAAGTTGTLTPGQMGFTTPGGFFPNLERAISGVPAQLVPLVRHAGSALGAMGVLIGDTLNESLDAMRSPLQGIVTVGESASALAAVAGGGIASLMPNALGNLLTQRGPAVNLNLPPMALREFMEGRNRLYTPYADQEDFQSQIAGRHGPGSKFAQMTEARFLLGGGAAEMMDRQFYIMETTVGHRLDTLINLTRSNRPMPILGE